MKKKLTLLMVAITVFLIFAPAISVEANSSIDTGSGNAGITTLSVPSTMSVQWEETTWYFSIKDGYFWKRQWSITYGVWLTDWIRLAPYDGDPPS